MSRSLLSSAALTIALALLAAASCGRKAPESTPAWSDKEVAMLRTLSPLPEMPHDDTNAYADDARAARLGQALFFETGFSRDGSVSCASCHRPTLYFCDAQPTAVGMHPMKRHTQSVIGSQWAPFFFWDGRKDSLWSQALAPIESVMEQGSTRLGVAHRVHARHRAAYEEVFGPMPALEDVERFPLQGLPVPGQPDHPLAQAWARMARADQDAVCRVFANVGKSIAAYERLLLPRPAPFDRYVAAVVAGDPTGGNHLSEAAVRGLRSFIGPAGCIHCHNGPLFSDFAFHNVGLPPQRDRELDPGRATGAWEVLADPFRSDSAYSDAHSSPEIQFLKPSFEDFQGAFRTPSLRNVAATAPYGHAGQLATLEEVVDFYRELPRVPMLGHRDLILMPLGDTVSTSDIVAFLRCLTGPLPDEHLLTAPMD